MKMKRRLLLLAVLLAFLVIFGCIAKTLPPGNKPLIPLKQANLEAVFEENEGLEVTLQDTKEVRDFYRGGVQLKAKAERLFQEKAYPEAMRLYRSSNDFFSNLFLHHLDEDSAAYDLFEGTHILFFPNLLMADNYLKMGLILRETGEAGQAQPTWERALFFVKSSLRTEPSEWGLAMQEELLTLLKK
jgi:tetratricopeptide (TPR) repeat protein